jgi:CelD/BcsL family acetyltransferase involved in cellulose biosynthesis
VGGREVNRASRGGPIGRSLLPLTDSLSIRIEVFHYFSEVETTWREAQEHCACYGFQTFEWLSTWQETIGVAERIEPHIVHIADASGNTLMLLPLGFQQRLGLSFVSFLGGVVTDYHAPIVRAEFAADLDAAALNRLMSYVLERLPRVDVIALEKMPSMIGDVSNPLAMLPDTKHVYNAYVATLGDTFTDFKKRRSAKFFSTAARKWRRLSEIAATRFSIAESPDTVTEILRVLVRQKRRQGQEVGFSDLFARPGYLAFYSTMAERHLATGLIQTSALRVGETVVATHWGMVFRKRFYWLMPTYEAGEWVRFSIGRLLMQKLVEWSISHGLKDFDLTIGDEAYKGLWADHALPLYESVCGLTGKGKVYREVRLVGRWIKDYAKQREWLRSLVSAWRRRRASS